MAEIIGIEVYTMLRRFFISLIILSALASEGLAGLPMHFYAFYAYSNSGVNTVGIQGNIQDQLEENQQSGMQLDKAASNGVFVLSAGSIQKLKYRTVSASLNSEKSFYTSSPVADTLTAFVPKADKGAILKRSDSSPPNC